jgi:hypothetical protein
MNFWANFWDVIWWFFWVFAFIAYLMALFAIIGDLFRDHKLSGWWKAVWIIFLIIVPFLSALIYVIARGTGMAERHQAARGPREADTYVPPPIIHMSTPADQIASAQTLLDQGAITQAEFDQLKQKALA